MSYPAKRKSAKGYDLATREQLLERLAACGSLRAVCKAADMPSAATVHVWLQQDAELAGAYARAKAIGIQLFADETLESLMKRWRHRTCRQRSCGLRRGDGWPSACCPRFMASRLGSR